VAPLGTFFFSVAFRNRASREYAAARILDSLGLLSDGLVAAVGASMELS
jgi:hypothetical protein